MDSQAYIEKISNRLPGAILSSVDRYGQMELRVDRAKIHEVVQTLRDDSEFAFNMLIDIIAVDYSTYPDWTEGRFGVIYQLKSLGLGHRLQLKVMATEEDPMVPTISDLYGNANWLEREAFDQIGVRFAKHPNLKRLLNHHEFVGHPLRKDYPITRRQALSMNETLMDEMDERLKQKGYV
jgi:NADH-quinone oxidoreductase subunit C